MNKIRHYIDFNAAPNVNVFKTNQVNYYSAAICKYNSTNLSSFFLREDTMTYVLGGKKYMFINNQEFYLSEGDLLYIPKNTVIFTHITTVNSNFESLNILLDKENVHKLWDKTILFKQSNTLKMQMDAFLNNGFSAVIETKRVAALQELLCFLELSHLEYQNKTLIYQEDNLVISNVVINTIFEPMNIDTLAAESYMSVSTFKRKFKKHFQESPKTWIRNIRLQAAFFYLKTNLYKVSDVAAFVGFENLAHFTYAFGRYFNQRPSSIGKKK